MRPTAKRVVLPASLLAASLLVSILLLVRGSAPGREVDTVDRSRRDSAGRLDAGREDHVEASNRAVVAEARPRKPLIVRTLDTRGFPIAGAEVFATDYRPARPLFEVLGHSDAGGSLQVTKDLTPPVWIIARSSDFVPRDDLIEKEIPEVLELRLRPSASITGKVIEEESGSPVGPGARVLAWATGLLLPPTDLPALALSGDPRCAFTTTDPVGSFALSVPLSGGSISIAAGSQGLGMLAPVQGLAPQSEGITLRLSQLYGMHIRLLDENTGEPAVAEELLSSGRMPLDVRASAASFLYQPNLALALAGITQIPPYGRTGDEVYVFAGPRSLGRVGPFEYAARVPSYVESLHEVWAEPVRDEVPQVDLPLQAVARERGSIRVASSGLPEEAMRGLFLQGGFGKLVLRDRSTRMQFEYAIRDLQSAQQILTGIPFGEYDVRFGSHASFFSYRTPGPVRVSPEPADIVVDFSGRGSLELRLWRQDRTRYTGAVTVTVTEGDPQPGGPQLRIALALFDRPPYLLIGLPAHVVGVMLDHPKPASGTGSLGLKVTVGPDEVTLANVEVAEGD